MLHTLRNIYIHAPTQQYVALQSIAATFQKSAFSVGPHIHTHPAIHPFGDVTYEQPLGDLGRRSGHQQPLLPRFLCHHAGKSCHQLDVTMQKSAQVFDNLS